MWDIWLHSETYRTTITNFRTTCKKPYCMLVSWNIIKLKYSTAILIMVCDQTQEQKDNALSESGCRVPFLASRNWHTNWSSQDTKQMQIYHLCKKQGINLVMSPTNSQPTTHYLRPWPAKDSAAATLSITLKFHWWHLEQKQNQKLI